MPTHDVWLEMVCLSFDPLVKGNDSATSLILAVLPDVNITEYSFELV